MPVTKEFTVLIEERPTAFGKVCRALAESGVNILALQSFPIVGKIVTRFIVAPRGFIQAEIGAPFKQQVQQVKE